MADVAFRAAVCAALLPWSSPAGAADRVPPQKAEMAGYLLVPHGRVDARYNAGFSMYVAAWPLLKNYPHASHSGKNYPLQLAGGGALGFRHGKLHASEGNRKVPLANLFVAMLNAVDVPTEKFADNTGAMTELNR